MAATGAAIVRTKVLEYDGVHHAMQMDRSVLDNGLTQLFRNPVIVFVLTTIAVSQTHLQTTVLFQ
jgi:hypothetical protein